jgi:hypothetical protein
MGNNSFILAKGDVPNNLQKNGAILELIPDTFMTGISSSMAPFFESMDLGGTPGLESFVTSSDAVLQQSSWLILLCSRRIHTRPTQKLQRQHHSATDPTSRTDILHSLLCTPYLSQLQSNEVSSFSQRGRCRVARAACRRCALRCGGRGLSVPLQCADAAC